jgi:hypothetical protein
LNPKKLIVLADDIKVISKVEIQKLIQLPDEGENEYLEILKIEAENVWFFYQGHIVNYNFKKNKLFKTYDLTKWNVHQAILDLDKTTIWLISNNDGQLYGLQLELTKKELDEKVARLKKEKKQGYIKPDKARIEAQKAAEEKYKPRN